MAKIYVGDIGTLFNVNMGENVSGGSSLTFNVKKPDGTIITWTPTLYGTNYLRYSSVSGDLDSAGTWVIQPSLTLATWTGGCDPVTFKVHARQAP